MREILFHRDKRASSHALSLQADRAKVDGDLGRDNGCPTHDILEPVGGFTFRSLGGKEIAPNEWLHLWAARYPLNSYPGYCELIAKQKTFSGTDFEEVGKWKDRARTPGRWKPNVASVAYPVWKKAAEESPKRPEDSAISDFLTDWSQRSYTDLYRNKSQTKHFGLSRATTLLHFLSGGRFPIFDGRVRRAIKRLLGSSAPNTVSWYLDSYCKLFREVADLCGTEDRRALDMALFSYGDPNILLAEGPQHTS